MYATFYRAWPRRNMQRAWNFWSWFWYKYVMLDKTYMYGCTNFIYEFFFITHFICWSIILKLLKRLWHLCNFTCECKNLVKFTRNFDALSFGNNAKVHTSHIIKDSYDEWFKMRLCIFGKIWNWLKIKGPIT